MQLSNAILPLNAKPIEKALDVLGAKQLDMDLSPVDTNPLTCPKQLLPYLAAMWRVAIDQLTEQEQRQLIVNALEIHRYKGTVHAVKKGLDSLNLESEITPWYAAIPKAEPHTFTVDIFVYDKGISPSLLTTAREKINSGKALSTRYSLTVNLGVHAERYHAGTLQVYSMIEGKPYEPILDDINTDIYQGGTLQVITHIEGQPTNDS